MNGAGVDAPTESVSISGAQGRTQDFGGGSEDELQQRIQEFRDRVQRWMALSVAGLASVVPAAGVAEASQLAGSAAAALTSTNRTARCISRTTTLLLDATPYA